MSGLGRATRQPTAAVRQHHTRTPMTRRACFALSATHMRRSVSSDAAMSRSPNPASVPSSPTPISYSASPAPSASRHLSCVTSPWKRMAVGSTSLSLYSTLPTSTSRESDSRPVEPTSSSSSKSIAEARRWSFANAAGRLCRALVALRLGTRELRASRARRARAHGARTARMLEPWHRPLRVQTSSYMATDPQGSLRAASHLYTGLLEWLLTKAAQTTARTVPAHTLAHPAFARLDPKAEGRGRGLVGRAWPCRRCAHALSLTRPSRRRRSSQAASSGPH